MAVRKISTRLAIEGESEYRAKLAQINSDLKVQQSALKMVESQYKSNAGSIEALTAKGKALDDLYFVQKKKVDELREALKNAEKAQETYRKEQEKLEKSLKDNAAAQEALKKSTGDTSQEQKALKAEEIKLNDELKENSARLNAASRGVADWQIKLNSAQGELYDLNSELIENQKALDSTKESTEQSTQATLENERATNRQNEALNDLSIILAGSKIPKALNEIKDALLTCVNASIEFESAMAGVRKTTDLPEEEISTLGDRFKALSTEMPIAASELAGIAETAGQLGIQKESLESFTVTMANLGVATNMTSEEAATMLARFANVTDMDPGKYKNLGSVIVDLGNNFATTETEITEMAQRVAAAGRLAGLTEPEILALATSMSSVGIQAEAGGTAMTQTLTAIEKAVTSGGKKLESFASVAGMSAEQFAAVWKSASAEAIENFIAGLGRLDEQGESATQTLDDLGLSGIRQSNMLKSMSLASDMMSRAMETANSAWEENTALAREAETRYSTTESKFSMFKNSVDNLEIAIGDKLNPALGDLAEAGTSVLNWAADFAEQNEWIVPGITAVVAALAVYAGGVTLATLSTTALTAAIKAATVAALHNPFILSATAVAALGTAIFTVVSNAKNASKEVEELSKAAGNLNDTLEQGQKNYEDTVAGIEASANMAGNYIDQLKELEAAGLKTEEQQRNYHTVLQLLCDTVPELAQYIDLETNTIDGGTAALERNTAAWAENAKAQAYQDRLIEVYKAQADVQYELELNEVKRETATKKREAAVKGLSKAEERQTEIQKKLAEAQEKARLDDQKAAEEVKSLSHEYEENKKEIKDYVQQISEADREIELHREAIEADNEALDNANSEADAAKKAYDELTKSQAKNTGSAEDNAEAQAAMAEAQEEVRQKIEDLAEEYKRVYDEAYNSISGQTGLFGEFSAKLSEDTDTVEEMMGRWAKQTENVANYTKNLKLAAQYGIDEGLIQSLSDGSAESAAYLQTIINKYTELGANADTTKEKIESSSGDLKDFHEKFNAAFQGTEDAKNAFATTVTDMSGSLKALTAEAEKAAKEVDFSGFREALQEAISGKSLDYQVLGAEMSEGLAAGITEGSDQAKSAAEAVGQEVQEGLKEGLESGEDTSGAKETGKAVSGDLQRGIEEGREGVSAAVEDTGKEIQTGMKNAGKQAVKEFDEEFSKGTEKARQRANEIKKAIESGMSGLPGKLRTIGEQSIDGMIEGLNNRSGALYAKVSEIVNGAMSSARTAADTHSPSKKTIKIFEDVGDGMIVGLESKRSKLQATMESVINSALKMDARETVGDALKGMEIPPSYQSVQPPAPNENRYQIGDIKVDIHCESGDPDEIYNAFSTRLQRDIVRAGTANAARV